jgi:murein DD-endopeptidase MepM/ murein hydrolase activator NlpD
VPTIRRAVIALASSLVLAPPAVASDPPGGGFAAPERPKLAGATCEAERTWRCAAGERLEITGEHLDGVRRVVFAGRPGRADDRAAPVLDADPHALTLTVPKGVRSGRIIVRGPDGRGAVSRRRLEVVRRPRPAAGAAQALPPGSFAFPIAGRYEIGREPVQGFGGGRNHKGHDVFADCGTPLVAVTDARVQFVATHSAAGHYVVLQDAAGRSYAYMHMARPTGLRRGDAVRAGQPVGEVGDTGRASGCHLHFELWTAPGWYEGGEAIDPLPELERWAAGAPPA